MTNLLKLKSSIYSENGQSSQLVDSFVDRYQLQTPNLSIVERDLGGEPIPHLDAFRFGAFLSDSKDRSPEQQAVVDYSNGLIDELREADIIALGLPLYNFGVPSQLKAYFDHVARAGVTFRYTENGPEGLLKNKKAFVFAARGGIYAGTPMDTQTGYVRDFLKFIGIEDVEFVYVEGLAMGDQKKQDALEHGDSAIRSLLADTPLAA